jgi:TolA-binding protein
MKGPLMKKHIVFSLGLAVILLGCSKPSAEQIYKKGEDAQRAEQYNDALALFQELIDTYPDSTRTPEAYYAMGTIYQNSKKEFHLAIQSFRSLVNKYPVHATASSACFLIGFIYNNDLKNIDSARIAYEDFIKRYPTSQLIVSAQFELSNLGKDPSEILKAQSQIAGQETSPSPKGKKNK